MKRKVWWILGLVLISATVANLVTLIAQFKDDERYEDEEANKRRKKKAQKESQPAEYFMVTVFRSLVKDVGQGDNPPVALLPTIIHEQQDQDSLVNPADTIAPPGETDEERKERVSKQIRKMLNKYLGPAALGKPDTCRNVKKLALEWKQNSARWKCSTAEIRHEVSVHIKNLDWRSKLKLPSLLFCVPGDVKKEFFN